MATRLETTTERLSRIEELEGKMKVVENENIRLNLELKKIVEHTKNDIKMLCVIAGTFIYLFITSFLIWIICASE